ncbi:MAG: hypothetical protein AAGD32_16465 [Planctomycetota bacterium]
MEQDVAGIFKLIGTQIWRASLVLLPGWHAFALIVGSLGLVHGDSIGQILLPLAAGWTNWTRELWEIGFEVIHYKTADALTGLVVFAPLFGICFTRMWGSRSEESFLPVSSESLAIVLVSFVSVHVNFALIGWQGVRESVVPVWAFFVLVIVVAFVLRSVGRRQVSRSYWLWNWFYLPFAGSCFYVCVGKPHMVPFVWFSVSIWTMLMFMPRTAMLPSNWAIFLLLLCLAASKIGA